jgi:hypothetical protein
MRHVELRDRDSYDVVDAARIAAAKLEIIAEARPQPAPAVPDMPAAAGTFMVVVYAALMGAFALTMAGDGPTSFAILIGAFYLFMFFAVPAVFLGTEQNGARRPSLSEFLETGIETATGPISGAGALVQMLIVPFLLTLAVLAMGFTYLLG